MRTGPLNLLTDVAGVRVGHADDPRVMSGVTAVLIDMPNAASAVIRGGAPANTCVSALEPEMIIPGLDAVLLSGGSAFGLDATGGAMACLAERGIGFRIGTALVPLVAQAITFDLLNGGDKAWGRRPPYFDLGWSATERAAAGAFALGSVGGGYGVTTATLKGGVGSASAVASTGATVGAIALVNAVGTVTVGSGPHFWAAPYEQGSEFGGLGFPATLPPDALRLVVKGGAPPSTTIALVATDATLTKAETKRLAIMADDGLARAVRPAHAPMDGDTVFASATCRRPAPASPTEMTELGHLAADCLARAIARGVWEAARPLGPYAGPPSHRDRFPRG